jgi:hypothetical protein
VPEKVLDVLDKRSGNTTVGDLAKAFAEQALRRDVELLAQSSPVARYFRVVWHGTTVAYVHPRATVVRVDYRLPVDHWSHGWGFSQDNPRGGIGPDIDGQVGFQVGMRLLDDAIRQASD